LPYPVQPACAVRDHRDDRDTALLREFARTRDPLLRERLVRRYLRLARFVAGRYARGGEAFDDLFQVASVGLLKAIDRFDPDNGSTFAGYAFPTMTGEVLRHLRDHGWSVRPPRDLLEQSLRVERVADDLGRRLGRRPTLAELAGATGLDEPAVLEARMAVSARVAMSLSAGADEEGEPPLEDRLGCQEAGFRRAEQQSALASLMRELTPREREVLRLRFEEDLTQAEIGSTVGLSQMHISRVLGSALEKLRMTAAKTAAAALPSVG
jgi:RNA polymerase sigma-B factor